MRRDENDTYDIWVEKARLYELKLAQQKIENGADIEEVLNSMSRNLCSKYIHPLIEELKVSVSSNYDPVTSRNNYINNYLKKTKLVADHMNDAEF